MSERLGSFFGGISGMADAVSGFFGAVSGFFGALFSEGILQGLLRIGGYALVGIIALVVVIRFRHLLLWLAGLSAVGWAVHRFILVGWLGWGPGWSRFVVIVAIVLGIALFGDTNATGTYDSGGDSLLTIYSDGSAYVDGESVDLDSIDLD